MQFEWEFASHQQEQIQSLSTQLGVSPLVSHLLIQRGFSDAQDAWKFLNPSMEDLYDPYLLRDMDRVVKRVSQAMDRREKILIYGDYDVDGITSTVVLKRALEMLGADVDYYLPQRLEEGYGVRTEVLRRAHGEGCRLVITVDSGIREFEPAAAARQIGLDFIITDHHPPEHTLPAAYAILNPRCPGCPYPNKNLAAVGVVFKLVQALFHQAGREKVVHHFLKLVAIGTVADVVPLTGENRIIVWHGIRALADPRNPGLRALLDAAGVSREIGFFDLGFKLAPRINAVTRMGGGREVVDLFSVSAESDARSIVQEMNTKNLLRRKEEARILEEIEKRFLRDPAAFQKEFLVVAGEGWHRGVLGIVASRLVERFHRPVLVLSFDEDCGQGSGRSIPGFDLLGALDHCHALFTRYGGHSQAVGCTLHRESFRAEKMNELDRVLQEYAATRLSPDQLIPSLQIESVVRPEDISLSLYEDIERLAPFGQGNPLPVFASQNISIAGGPWVLKTQHLKLQVRCDGSRLDAIWWKQGKLAHSMRGVSQVDLAYTISKDQYLGKEKLLLTIRDLRVGGSP